MVIRQKALDAVFMALADPHRRRIVERLANGPMSIGAAADGIPITQPAVSKHVRILERAGLVAREIRGREHHLRLTPQAMQGASAWMEAQRAYWLSAFDRLDAHFANTADKD